MNSEGSDETKNLKRAARLNCLFVGLFVLLIGDALVDTADAAASIPMGFAVHYAAILIIPFYIALFMTLNIGLSAWAVVWFLFHSILLLSLSFMTFGDAWYHAHGFYICIVVLSQAGLLFWLLRRGQAEQSSRRQAFTFAALVAGHLVVLWAI